MNNNQHTNGNTALNNSRENVNASIEKYANLSKSKKLAWNKKRRYRGI